MESASSALFLSVEYGMQLEPPTFLHAHDSPSLIKSVLLTYLAGAAPFNSSVSTLPNAWLLVSTVVMLVELNKTGPKQRSQN